MAEVLTPTEPVTSQKEWNNYVFENETFKGIHLVSGGAIKAYLNGDLVPGFAGALHEEDECAIRFHQESADLPTIFMTTTQLCIDKNANKLVGHLIENYLKLIGEVHGRYNVVLIPTNEVIANSSTFFDQLLANCRPGSILILPGGEHIYSEDPALLVGSDSYGLDRIRDRVEQSALKSFFEKGLGVYGICRGEQLAGAAFGITRCPVGEMHKPGPKESLARHSITFLDLPDSIHQLLAGKLGPDLYEEFLAIKHISSHHQTGLLFEPDRLPEIHAKGVFPLAIAPAAAEYPHQQIIEIFLVVSPDGRCMLFAQSHPEKGTDPVLLEVFQKLNQSSNSY